ncbi:MAG TPA: DNA polymerase III subunit gamma/tau, partial [Cellvibrionaceae bacterium]|nr:DNA polymerase III subunit gamma/tau [Cellvibrionaceae bacterium]
MSYQVLARKWRPKIFREMVGQEHVLRALINALDHNRLHHAYLFTGTRGVGKTSIARILAKCLNCERGVTSEPCGVCSACKEIAEGRFVDLIEVDAASRTKVEDTRELLDNVQYLPSRGRYKVYLIDEVHMLSSSSFNALLKTLEEPPEHVKFLLATTDPQKLPVTVLSRCLQFNLKNMSPERIVGHLGFVLGEEQIPFEEAALWQLARAADGSMRDSLSLTDQAIAFGCGKVASSDVAAMLGTIDYQLIAQVMQGLIDGDGRALLQAVAAFAEHAPDYFGALGDLVTLLHRVAIAQALPEAVDNSFGDRQQILHFSRALTPEDVQLFYQTALIGRRDLHLSPDPRAGFEMTLLRMLAFKPQGLLDLPQAPLHFAGGQGAASSAPAGLPLAEPVAPPDLPPQPEPPSKTSFVATAPADEAPPQMHDARADPLAFAPPAPEPL